MLDMLKLSKMRKYLVCLRNKFCSYCSFIVLFLKRNFMFFFAFFCSSCVFFFVFNEEFLKFIFGNFDTTQSFFQTFNGFDGSQNSQPSGLTDQEKHLRKVNLKLDHQIKQAEEARQFAQEREKNPELQKYLKDHALVLNVFVFVFCWMVIFNTISHMPPSSPPTPPK